MTIAMATLALCTAPVPGQESVGLKPFTVDHRNASGSAVNLTSLLAAPAGQGGFIGVRGGHLAKPDGSRFRIWGVNITDFARGSIHFPDKEDAAFWAEALARLGVNCVRMHSFDVEAPKGIIAANRGDTREFDTEQLDRLDYFVAELKKRGIYSDLNLNVGRTYKAGDGVKDYALIGAGKALTYFDPRLIELQKEYARKLLMHYNPYTKSEYRNEPAIAIVELVNENSIVAAWDRGRLNGQKTGGAVENWQDIPPSYERDLTRLYHEWLQRKGRALVPRLTPDEFAAASKDGFETELQFYMDLESGFFRDMQRYLKETLGSKSLLIGTSDYTYAFSSYPMVASTSLLDIVDGHGPWESRPMVGEPLNSVPVRLSRSAVAGKPFVVTEHNHRFPSAYQSEGIPLLAAYGAFQDWDGIFLYTFEMKPRRTDTHFIASRADLSQDPVKTANLAAGALLFLRADVSAARETVARSYSAEEVKESLRAPSPEDVYFTPGFSSSVALRHESRIGSLDRASPRAPSVKDESPIASDTGELKWYFTPGAGPLTVETDQKFASGASSTGMVTVDSPRTQALIGFLPTYKSAVTNLAADIRNRFAALVLTSLDSRPVMESSRMLLTATSRVSNTGNGPPTLIEPVTGTIVLRNLAKASAVYCEPLDGAGRRIGEPVAAERIADGWRVRLGDIPTSWYEITLTPTNAPQGQR
jgi:hypothetical protein